MQHERIGPRARFERYAADMLFWIASGKHIDDEKSPRFEEFIDSIYRNPFGEKKKPMTAKDIKQHVLQKIQEARERLRAGG